MLNSPKNQCRIGLEPGIFGLGRIGSVNRPIPTACIEREKNHISLVLE